MKNKIYMDNTRSIWGPAILSIVCLLLSNEGKIELIVGTECLVFNNGSSWKNMKSYYIFMQEA
jgi:hypothetical protein